MRDWFEQHLQRVLREHAREARARPLSLWQVRRRAHWLVIRHAVAWLALAVCLVALVLVD